ncbi:LIM domain only protein 7 [Bagarius yarrelli]|uniref:LIM domain only protein 7 n=1 Tax=Bagarius yarrelli TaxID=175774 RepID=A0A556TKX4_BAGYA|nr:LIM domain only protein 7 [Bagarius yarrelli]
MHEEKMINFDGSNVKKYNSCEPQGHRNDMFIMTAVSTGFAIYSSNAYDAHLQPQPVYTPKIDLNPVNLLFTIRSAKIWTCVVMERREHMADGCELAFHEARRWMEEVTKKRFGSSNFRSALESGVLLCDLINQLKPGIIKKLNRLSTPIAGLDNINVFLKACKKLGLNDAQLFHPGDLQDVSTRVTVRHQETSRRLKNVLITIYWLGRKAHADPSYRGPQLNLKAFEGLLGVALSKALEEASCSKFSVRDSGFAENWYPDREVPSYKREDSVESLDSVESHTLSAASDCTLKAGSEGFGSDAEAELCFRMSETLSAPCKKRGNLPAALRRKRFGQQEEVGRGHVGPLHSKNGQGLVSPCLDLPPVSAFHQWAHEYQTDSESDSDRPEPDPVQDDLASRRFRSTTATGPVNFTVPLNPGCMKPFSAVTPSARRSWVTMSDASRLAAVPRESLSLSADGTAGYKVSAPEDEFFLRACQEDSSESDESFADPVQDDLYTRRVLQATHQTSINTNTDKFLPKFWTPEEDVHVRRIKLGSQRRPWYKKIQGLRSKSMSDLNLEPGTQEAESITALYLLKSRPSKAATVSLRQERIRLYQAGLRESEVKWQEDLNRWKTRRWSVTSDLHKKQEERQQLELISGGNVHVGEQQKQWRSLQREEPNVSCVSTSEASSSSLLTSSGRSMPGPVIPTGPAPANRGCSYIDGPIQPTPHTLPVVSAASDQVQNVSPPSFPALGTASVSDSAPVPLQRAKSLEGVLSETPQMSAVLPRGFRRSEGTSRLSTGVTPRPFSSKMPRLSAQAKFYSVDETNNSPQVLHQLPASVPQQATDAAPIYKDDACFNKHAAVLQNKKEEKVREKREASAPSIRSFMSASVLVSKAVSVNSEDELDHRDMRVSLNQTPGSGTDFGFLAHWDSTGARIKSVTAGSPAQLCHLQAGDEIVALAGQRVAEMSYEQWKANMDAALREGKLLMDIRRISLNGHSDDHTPVSSTSSLRRKSENKTQLNGHPVKAVSVRVTKATDDSVPTKPKAEGSLTQCIFFTLVLEPRRGKEETGEVADGAGASLAGREKYRRDQERLEEAWRQAQHEAAVEKNCNPDVSQPLKQSKSPTSLEPTQSAQEGTLVHSKQVQIAASYSSKDLCNSSSMTSQWQSECYGFTKLNASDRKKSKSTPTLDGSHKQDPKASIKKKGRLSQAEQERLQILEEMRKKTPVLTDSSWIRQRSTCTIHKEPIDVAPLRRHESLDNVHSSSISSMSSISLSKQFSGSSQILSGLSGIVPYRGYSGRCSLGPGAAIFSSTLRQSSWTRPSFSSPVSDTEEACDRAQQQNRPASRRRLCSRCEQPLLKGPAIVIESLDLCFHVACFKSIPAFPNDLEASLQIREEPFSEDNSDTAAT